MGCRLARLPLDRLVEIHASGPRLLPDNDSTDNGTLFDVHEPMQEADYALLAWVLERTRPQAVTLEYSRDRTRLKAQLNDLRALLDSLV